MKRWHALISFLMLSLLFPSLILIEEPSSTVGAYISYYYGRESFGYFLLGSAYMTLGSYMALPLGIAISCWVNFAIGAAVWL